MAEAPAQKANGAGAAAVVAAGVGCFALGVLALAGDAFAPVAHVLDLWAPTGPLSGVTTAAIVAWLSTWLLLGRRWARRSVNLAVVNLLTLALVVAGLLLTFPPFMDFLQGR